MIAHRWVEIDGATYCATCGKTPEIAAKGGEEGQCRAPEVKTSPSPQSGEARAIAPALIVPEFTGSPRSDAEMAEYRWANETLPRMRAAGFLGRHRCRIKSWGCRPQEAVFRRCASLCRGVGAIIVLTGERGTGKTTICAQLARLRAEDEALPPWDRRPPYRKLVDLIAALKPLYGNMGAINMEALTELREAFCGLPSLAFIDEIHECEDAALKNRVLTDLIDRRYAARKDTILVSNQSVEDFSATTSDSIRSRISEHGEIIPCNWSSWRAK